MWLNMSHFIADSENSSFYLLFMSWLLAFTFLAMLGIILRASVGIKRYWFILTDSLSVFKLLLLSPNQANELLQSSKQVQNKVDKERTLRESLRLYQQISQHTDLPLVCSQYRHGTDTKPLSVFVRYIIYRPVPPILTLLTCLTVRFYEGVLELCLTAADKKDPQRLGPHFYKNGEPEEDRVGQQAFLER